MPWARGTRSCHRTAEVSLDRAGGPLTCRKAQADTHAQTDIVWPKRPSNSSMRHPPGPSSIRLGLHCSCTRRRCWNIEQLGTVAGVLVADGRPGRRACGPASKPLGRGWRFENEPGLGQSLSRCTAGRSPRGERAVGRGELTSSACPPATVTLRAWQPRRVSYCLLGTLVCETV